MKSQRFSRKIIFAAGFFTVLLFLYFHFGLVPGRLKNAAIKKIEELTGNKVAFTKALVLPFRGLCLYDLKVANQNGFLIFSAKEMAINARLLPFFKEKKIIISSVYLNAPVYDFQLKPTHKVVKPRPPKTKISGEIDVPVISEENTPKISDIAGGPDAFLPENVYLEEIRINDGLVTIRENAQGPVIEEINSIRIRMGFQKPPILKFDGSVALGKEHTASVSLKGNWNLDKAEYEFYLQTKSENVPRWLLDYQKNNFLILKSGQIFIETYLKSARESKALFHSKADLRNGSLSLNKASYTGHMALEVQGLFNFDTKSFERYHGDLNFLDVDVFHLSKDIPRLEGIKGNVRFEPDLLDIRSIEGQYKKVLFQAKGKIRSFKELLLEADIDSRSSIGDVLSLIPDEQKKILSGFEIEGLCQTRTTVRGSLRKPSGLERDYKLIFREGSLKNTLKKIYLTQMSADIAMDKSGVNLKNCRFMAEKTSYLLNLFIPKDPKTPGRLELRSGELKLTGTYLSENGKIVIRQAVAFWSGIVAKFEGTLSGLDQPYLNIKGDARFDLSHLPSNLVLKAPALKEMGLKGLLNGPFSLQGLWNNPLVWNFKLDGSGDPIYIRQKFRLNAAQFQLRMRNALLTIPYFSAAAYDGTLGGNVSFNLSQPEALFDGKIYLNQINLNALMEDLSPENKALAGNLNAEVKIRGVLKSQETFEGNGFVNIRNGHLWKTNLFREMGRLPFVRVQGLDLVVFNELGATFNIHDKKIWTEDLRLASDTVNLSLEGNIRFDQTLDLTMDIHYSKAVIDGAIDTGGIVPFVVQQAEDFISQYRISGTLKNPIYDKMNFPVGRAVGKKITGLVQTLTT